MSNLRIFTAVWGDAYVERFENACVKSLSWPKNLNCLSGATWDVYTKDEHVERIERTLWNKFDIKFECHILPEAQGPSQEMVDQALLHDSMRRQMILCLNSQSKLFLAPPDTIFGEGSVESLFKLGEAPGTAVVVPHVRVLPQILDSIALDPVENPKLVNLAWDFMHKSWVDAENGAETPNSFWSGVLWKKIGDRLYSVQHRVPTVYLVGFTGEDHCFWNDQARFGAWDHRWPGECLVRQERQRYCGSSDACMIVEVTEADKNVCNPTPPQVFDRDNPDKYWINTLHASHNRGVNAIFRGSL